MNRQQALEWAVENNWPTIDEDGVIDMSMSTPEGWEWRPSDLKYMLADLCKGVERITKHDLNAAKLSTAPYTVDIEEWAAKNIKYWPSDLTALPVAPPGWSWGGGFERGHFELHNGTERFTRQDWSPCYMIDDNQLVVNVGEDGITISYKGADRKKGLQTLIKYLKVLHDIA